MNFATETFPSSFLKVWYITSPSETLIKNKKIPFLEFSSQSFIQIRVEEYFRLIFSILVIDYAILFL